MPLNGWQRIGIVLSVVWLAVSIPTFYNQNYDLILDQHFDQLKTRCGDIENSYDFTACTKLVWNDHYTAKYSLWFGAASLSVTVLLAAWFSVYLTIAIIQWVAAGFKPHA